jgi:hypothetical protein
LGNRCKVRELGGPTGKEHRTGNGTLKHINLKNSTKPKRFRPPEFESNRTSEAKLKHVRHFGYEVGAALGRSGRQGKTGPVQINFPLPFLLFTAQIIAELFGIRKYQMPKVGTLRTDRSGFVVPVCEEECSQSSVFSQEFSKSKNIKQNIFKSQKTVLRKSEMIGIPS